MKRPPSAYFIYYTERIKEIKESIIQNANNAYQTAKLIGVEWKQMTEEEKQPYLIQAKQQMEEYKQNKRSNEMTSNQKRKKEMKPKKQIHQNDINNSNNQVHQITQVNQLHQTKIKDKQSVNSSVFQTNRETLFTLDLMQLPNDIERSFLISHKEMIIKDNQLPILKEDLQIVMGMGDPETKIMRLKEFYFELKLERKKNETLIESVNELFSHLSTLSPSTPNSLTSKINAITSDMNAIEQKMKLTMNEMISIKLAEKNEKIRKIETKYEEEVQALLNL